MTDELDPCDLSGRQKLYLARFSPTGGPLATPAELTGEVGQRYQASVAARNLQGGRPTWRRGARLCSIRGVMPARIALVALLAGACGGVGALEPDGESGGRGGRGFVRPDAGAPRRPDAASSDAAAPTDAPGRPPDAPPPDAPPPDAPPPDALPPDAPPPDAARPPDAAAGDGPATECPPVAAPDPGWLAAYQDRIVAELSGHAALPDGTRLVDRQTPANRARARDHLVALWRELGLEPRRQDYGSGSNVYADVPATRATDQVLVVGAHFDTVPGSPGANDNATGVALVYATARQLAAVPCRARHVRFVLFDEEEIGLVGSYHFASLLAGSSDRVTAVHTVDQMGWDRDDDRLVELERPDRGLFERYQGAVTAGGFAVPLLRTDTASSDHTRFRQAGFPAVGLTEGYASGDTTPHYHLPTDTYASVDFAYLRSTTRVVMFLLADELRAPAPPAPRPRLRAPPFVPIEGCRAKR